MRGGAGVMMGAAEIVPVCLLAVVSLAVVAWLFRHPEYQDDDSDA